MNLERESSAPESPGAGAPMSGLRAAVLGALSFGGVSVVVYGTVAFAGRWLYRTLTEAGAYGFWGTLYLLGAPWLLGRLLVPASKRRHYVLVFVLGFVAYAMGWVIPYFALRNKPGEILASVIGPALFAVVMAFGFRRLSTVPATAAVLVVGHGLGYFLGDYLNTTLRGPVGMVMWGVCHGLGFGAAIGWATRAWTADSSVDDLRSGTAHVPAEGGS
ncbi:MAG: hypothetical protein AB7O66_21145 [Limisphaerales bacterium]